MPNLIKKNDNYKLSYGANTYQLEVSNFPPVPDGDYHVTDIMVENVNEKICIKSFIYNGTTYNPANFIAKAPYNFVPVDNATVLEYHSNVDHSKFHVDNKYTGTIEITANALSDIFIRGKNEEFYEINGKPVLPGASMRGMTRNLVEVITYSKLQITDKETKLYYRNIGDRFYRSQFLSSVGGITKTNIKVGWLKYENNEFKIYPAIYSNVQGQATQWFKVFNDNYNVNFQFINFAGRDIQINSPDNIIEIFFDLNDVEVNHRTLQYFRINDPTYTEDTTKHKGFVICSGHVQGKHFHWVVNQANTVALNITNASLQKLKRNYENDTKREKNIQLFEWAKIKSKENGPGYPCFYIEDENGEILNMLGHTGIHRIKHKYNTKSLLSNHHNANSQLDFASHIFGNTNFASKVYFEDMNLISNSQPNTEEILNILGSPRVSYFPNYLKQSKTFATKRENLNHWSSTNVENKPISEIRGYKFYYHKRDDKRERVYNQSNISIKKVVIEEILGVTFTEGNYHGVPYVIDNENVIFNAKYSELPKDLKEIIHTWIYDPTNEEYTHFNLGFKDNPLQFSSAKTLPEGSKFAGKIRFENLSGSELGAMLFALDLPECCAHKIGMGKPLGLGSIRITAKLNIIDLKNSYSKFIDDQKYELNSAYMNGPSIQQFKTHFEKTILKQAGKNLNDIWQIDRFKELKAMLSLPTADMPNWNEYSKYMGLPEFAKRKVLPTATEVVELAKKNIKI